MYPMCYNNYSSNIPQYVEQIIAWTQNASVVLIYWLDI